MGLLFLIPGVGETLRVNGRARIVTDADLLEPLAVDGRAPRLALLVEVDEVFTHCPKAFIRSDLWNPATFAQSSDLPSPGAIHRSLNPEFDAEGYDAERAERYARREGLYCVDHGVRRLSVAAPSPSASRVVPTTTTTSSQKRAPSVCECAARSSASNA